MMCLAVLPVYAEEETADPEMLPEESAEPTPEPEPAYRVDASSAVLMDKTSGNILFEQDKDNRIDPASLTKLMTVYLGIENLSDDKELSMTAEAFETYDHSFGVLWIEQGESMSASSAEHATMLASANDTAAMIAEAVSSSQDAFITKMNMAAAQFGMENTHFQNIFGIHNDTNYSTAYDMALLLRKALGNETFRNIFGRASYTIPATNFAVARNLVNDCALLRDTGYYYEKATGGKIGNTPEGGFSLAATAKDDNGMELIAVVLGEENAAAAYNDIVSMFEYGFSNFQSITFSAEDIGEKTVEVMRGKKHVADVRFTNTGDYHVLLPTGLDASTLTAEAVVNNEEETNPEVITADVVFKLEDMVVGTTPMHREITYYDTSIAATAGPMIRQYFNYASIGVLGLFIIRLFLKVIHKLLAPPA